MYAARGALPPLAPHFFILECHCEARSAAAIPLNNRKGNSTIVSALIAPLKKAQRKSEGGQLFSESVFPLRATPFPKTPQKPPTPLIFKGVSVILLFYSIFSTCIIYCLCVNAE